MPATSKKSEYPPLVAPLPAELLIMIAFFLDDASTLEFSSACQFFSEVVKSKWERKLITLASNNDIHFDEENVVLLKKMNCKAVYYRLFHIITLKSERSYNACIYLRIFQHYLLNTPDMAFIAQYLNSFDSKTCRLNKKTPIFELTDALQTAILVRNSALAQYLLSLDTNKNKQNLKINQDLLDCAALSGSLSLLEHLLSLTSDTDEKIMIPTEGTLKNAIFSGNLALVKYLLRLTNDNHKPLLTLNEDIINECVFSGKGSMALLTYLFPKINVPNQPDAFYQKLLDITLGSGSQELFEGVLLALEASGNISLIDNQATLSFVVDTGNLDMLEYLLLKTRLSPTRETLSDAVCSGSPKLVKYLISIIDNAGEPLLQPNTGLKLAVSSGSLALTQFFLEKSECTINLFLDLLEDAASTGNLPLVKFILSKIVGLESESSEKRQRILHESAYSGNLTLVRYLLSLTDDKKKPLFNPDQKTLYFAAMLGNFPATVYLLSQKDSRGNALVIDQKLLRKAIQSSHLTLVLYLLTQTDKEGKPLLELTKREFNKACENSTVAVIDLIGKLREKSIDRESLLTRPLHLLETRPLSWISITKSL